MSNFTKSRVQTISNEIEAALRGIEKKHGVKIKRGNARFNEANFTLKLEVANVTASGNVETKERTSFKKNALRFGFRPTDLDREFKYHGRTYKITGLNTRAHKFPVQAESGGKRYKFPAEVVQALLG